MLNLSLVLLSIIHMDDEHNQKNEQGNITNQFTNPLLEYIAPLEKIKENLRELSNRVYSPVMFEFPLGEEIAEISNRFKQLSTIPAISLIQRITSQWKSEITASISILSPRAQIGKYGWVIPLFIPISADDVFNSDFNKYILDKYFSDDSEYFDRLSQEILSIISDESELQKIREGIQAYNAGLYAPCAHVLIPLVERFLLFDTGKSGFKKIKDSFKEQIEMKNLEDDFSYAFLFYALMDFIEVFYDTFDFSSDEPDIINRHWFVHGRSNQIVEKCHCVQLFCVIHTILIVKNIEFEE